MWFLWTHGWRGPVPRLAWSGPDGQPVIDDNLKDHVLSQHKLEPGDEGLGFEELTARYPAPCVTGEVVG